MRFQVKGKELKFDDGAWRLAAGNSGPIAFSPDGRFVSMTHGAISSRKQHPPGGHFGSFVFPIDNFSKVVAEAVADYPCSHVAVADSFNRVYLAGVEVPLSILEQPGSQILHLSFPVSGETTGLTVSSNGDLLYTGDTTTYLTPAR